MTPRCTVVRLFAVCALVWGVAACSDAIPPPELAHARSAYQRASAGAAAQVSPAELHTAKIALDKAEAAFGDDPEADRTKDLSYVALRKTQLAEAKAGVFVAESGRATAQKDFQQTAETELARTKEALTKERIARESAERRAKDAMEAVARIAAVKNDARGTVITLSGGVLFASGRSELLPIAAEKLTHVAMALKEQENQSILVEGHTDSLGSYTANQNLSQRRAESVRAYLVSSGIAPERVRAEGLGSSRPVADNTSAEGRANNRRVEIVVRGK
jgi:outer membrane protein OmpA-like peptidoglycan-associated protein